MTALGATLRRLRMESGLGLRDLARRLGVSSAYLSRVEHGLDAPPTPERLEAVAAELGVPPALLLEVGHRLSPFVERYAEHEPQAAALFLAIARRGLDADEIAEIHRFVERRFPREAAVSKAQRAGKLASAIEPDRVVVGLQCGSLADAYEIGAARLAALRGMPPVDRLAAMFRERDDEIGAGVGGGVVVPCTVVANARAAAAIVVIDPPLAVSTPDGVPVAVVVQYVVPVRSGDSLVRIAHVARLAARGLAASLSGIEHPDEVVRRIARLEAID